MGFTYQRSDITDITGGGGLGMDLTGTPATSGVRPDLIANAVLPKDQRTPLLAFNTAAVVLPAGSKFGRGNAPKDAFRGPGINNWDMSVMKNFKWHEGGRSVQFRFETYNTFNHVRFAAPNSDPTSSSFGVVSPAQQNSPRTIQMALKLSF